MLSTLAVRTFAVKKHFLETFFRRFFRPVDGDEKLERRSRMASPRLRQDDDILDFIQESPRRKRGEVPLAAEQTSSILFWGRISTRQAGGRTRRRPVPSAEPTFKIGFASQWGPQSVPTRAAPK